MGVDNFCLIRTIRTTKIISSKFWKHCKITKEVFKTSHMPPHYINYMGAIALILKKNPDSVFLFYKGKDGVSFASIRKQFINRSKIGTI